jgi:hypothetical protein
VSGMFFTPMLFLKIPSLTSSGQAWDRGWAAWRHP